MPLLAVISLNIEYHDLTTPLSFVSSRRTLSGMRACATLLLLAACGLAVSNAEVALVGRAKSSLKQRSSAKVSRPSSQVVDFQSVTETSCIAAATTSVAAPAASSQAQTLKMVGLFVLWYGFNAGYNVYNAYVKKDFQYPFAIATLQLFIGLLYAVPLWFLGIRKMPNINMEDFLRLLPIAMLNAAGHACAVNAMFEKGGGSFTHGMYLVHSLLCSHRSYLSHRMSDTATRTLITINYSLTTLHVPFISSQSLRHPSLWCP